jgi:hypothetical protein
MYWSMVLVHYSYKTAKAKTKSIHGLLSVLEQGLRIKSFRMKSSPIGEDDWMNLLAEDFEAFHLTRECIFSLQQCHLTSPHLQQPATPTE